MQKEFKVEDASKPIRCILSTTPNPPSSEPALIFTHGAGGTLEAAAVVNFSTGFSHVAPLLCFEGSSNLKSRATAFTAVMASQDFTAALGGRSLGARAAVVASAPTTTHLVLVSYPLQGPRDVRDQILLDLPASIKILFISGDRDSMCDLGALRGVRERMACESSLITVVGADHGMNVRPKKATDAVGRMTGELAARWLRGEERGSREGRVEWSAEGAVAWSGWRDAELGEAAPPSKKAKVGKAVKEVAPKTKLKAAEAAKEMVPKTKAKSKAKAKVEVEASKDESLETVSRTSRKRKGRS